ncbi:MAG: hypothetical protein ACOCT9_01955 [archaeon]
MPLPEPKNREEKQEFISRCMSNDTMKREFNNKDQRLAVCYKQWEKKNESDLIDKIDLLLGE